MPRVESFLFYALIALIPGQLLSHFYEIVPLYRLDWVTALFLFPLPLLLLKKTGLTKVILLYEILVLGAYTAAQDQNLAINHFSKTHKEGLWRVKIQVVLRSNDFNQRYYGNILSVDDTANSGKVLVTISKKDSTAPLKVGQQLVTKTEANQTTQKPWSF